MTIDLHPYNPKSVIIAGRPVPLEAIEHAAHQDDPVWCYYAGRAVPPQDEETRTLAAQYRVILDRIRSSQRADAERLRQERMRQCQDHRAARTEGPLPFFGPVAREENRAAHGNIREIDHCQCGAERVRLVNGGHEEVGAWH